MKVTSVRVLCNIGGTTAMNMLCLRVFSVFDWCTHLSVLSFPLSSRSSWECAPFPLVLSA